MGANQKVTVYYNDVDIETKPYTVRQGCPSETMSFKIATEYSERKVDSGEWSKYLIPELTGAEVIFE